MRRLIDQHHLQRTVQRWGNPRQEYQRVLESGCTGRGSYLDIHQPRYGENGSDTGSAPLESVGAHRLFSQ